MAIALGMLINLGRYESMIAEALHSGIVPICPACYRCSRASPSSCPSNTWCADWRVIVTVLGWLMTIGGIIRIVLPQVAITIGSTIYSGRFPRS